MLVLATISTAVARAYQVEVRDGWLEPINLYTLVALPSGTRKSVVFDAATAALLALELGQAMPVQASPLAVGSDARLRVVTDAPASPSTSPPPSSPPSAPLFVSDATPERVASLLSENGGRVSVLSDEGEICAIIGGRYGGSFEVFLKAHSGQVIAIERQGRHRVYVRRPALTLGLAVQPDVLETLARKKALRERGLLARFLVAVPASNVGFRTVAAPSVPTAVLDSYAVALQQLVQVYLTPDAPVRTLTLSDDAHAVFTAFEHEVETMLRPDWALARLPSWGSKLAGAVARLAGLVQVARDPQKQAAHVDTDAVASAITIGRYLIPHAIEAFGQAGSDRVLADAQAILAWVREERLPTVTRREVHQNLRSRFDDVTGVDEPLRLLTEHGYVRRRPQPVRQGRPSPSFDVHPSLAEF